MAYLELSNWIYYPVLIISYVLCLLAAIFCQNIVMVFDLIGAFGFSLICFLLPALSYLALQDGDKIDKVRCTNKILSYLCIAISIANMVLVAFKTFFMPNDEKTDEDE